MKIYLRFGGPIALIRYLKNLTSISFKETTWDSIVVTKHLLLD